MIKVIVIDSGITPLQEKSDRVTCIDLGFGIYDNANHGGIIVDILLDNTNIEIISIKTLNEKRLTSFKNLLSVLRYILNENIEFNAINMSFAINTIIYNDSSFKEKTTNVLEQLSKKGIIFASYHNSIKLKPEYSFPANLDNVIGVYTNKSYQYGRTLYVSGSKICMYPIFNEFSKALLMSNSFTTPYTILILSYIIDEFECMNKILIEAEVVFDEFEKFYEYKKNNKVVTQEKIQNYIQNFDFFINDSMKDIKKYIHSIESEFGVSIDLERVTIYDFLDVKSLSLLIESDVSKNIYNYVR